MLSPLLPLLLLAAPAPATPPDGPTRAEAAALTAPRFGADQIEDAASEEGELILRAWAHRPGTWVAMIPEISELDSTGCQTATLHLAVLARNGQRWTALARADVARTADDAPGGELSYQLDLAPYRLDETEVAFGVREHGDQKSPTRPQASENLLLYRLVGARLVRVLSLQTDFEWTDEDGNGTGIDHATVAVSKNKTGGFFDLVVTTSCNLPRLKITVTRYTWAGEAYQEVTRPKPSPARRSKKVARPARR